MSFRDGGVNNKDGLMRDAQGSFVGDTFDADENFNLLHEVPRLEPTWQGRVSK